MEGKHGYIDTTFAILDKDFIAMVSGKLNPKSALMTVSFQICSKLRITDFFLGKNEGKREPRERLSFHPRPSANRCQTLNMSIESQIIGESFSTHNLVVLALLPLRLRR
jgi:hypothetical protein